jgi:hypothetical protein
MRALGGRIQDSRAAGVKKRLPMGADCSQSAIVLDSTIINTAWTR